MSKPKFGPLYRITETSLVEVNDLEPCGYLREPERLGLSYLCGTCALTGKRCEGNPPKMLECQIYKNRFK